MGDGDGRRKKKKRSHVVRVFKGSTVRMQGRGVVVFILPHSSHFVKSRFRIRIPVFS